MNITVYVHAFPFSAKSTEKPLFAISQRREGEGEGQCQGEVGVRGDKGLTVHRVATVQCWDVL